MSTRPVEASPTSSPATSADSPTGGAAGGRRTNGRPINSSGAGADPASNVTLRALISSREAGIIIGKGGKTVAELRETTGTKAGVSKAVPEVQDRIFSVSGGLEGVSKAYCMITEAIVQNSIVATDSSQVIPPPGTTIRLLIAHNLMGSIIGKQGMKIKEIQDVSGVRMVASKEMLPQSTERIVEVQGTSAAIKSAVYEISKCLMEDWERSHGTVLYQPGALGPDGVTAAYPGGVLQGGFGLSGALGAGNRRLSSGAPGGGGGFRADREGSYRRREGAGENGLGGGGRPRNGSAGEPPALSTAAAENLRTQNISIPSDMVGCIIGKGGTKINEIRRLSGSRISIAKVPHDETGERMFTITGTPEANEKALFLLYNQLESEKERRVNSADNEDQQ